MFFRFASRVLGRLTIYKNKSFYLFNRPNPHTLRVKTIQKR